MALIIYKLKNKINDKIYIGQTIKKLSERISGYIKSNSPIGRAIRKYGLESFDISIVDIAEDKNTLNEKEKKEEYRCAHIFHPTWILPDFTDRYTQIF